MHAEAVPGAARTVVCLAGRMGDVVAAEPIFRYLKERHPERPLVWYTRERYADVLRYSPMVDEVRLIRREEDFLAEEALFSPEDEVYRINFKPRSGPGRKKMGRGGSFVPLLRAFCRETGLDELDEAPRFHFSPHAVKPERLPERYVVFHCMPGGKSRVWTAAKFRRLARYAIGRGLAVAEIGLKPILDLDDAQYFDMTGEHDIQNIARIIEGAELLIGVESGFGHIANALGKFGIFILGRLRNFPEYNVWSGAYGRGENCSLLRFYGENAISVPESMAEHALDAFLSGHPLSGAACREYCLLEQIRRLHQNPVSRLCRCLTRPFHLARAVLEYRRRRG